MNLKNFELIIFDLDGTLVNSAKDIMIANNKTLVKFGYKPISFKNVKDIIGQGIRVNIIRSLKMQKIKISKKKENEMHDYFYSKGYTIYPGKTLDFDTFRIANKNRTEEDSTLSGWNGRTSGNRIDWVLCSRNYRVLSAMIDRTEFSGRYPSDHYPVTTILRPHK